VGARGVDAVDRRTKKRLDARALRGRGDDRPGLRVGTSRTRTYEATGSGYFFGIEAREALGTTFFSVSLGTTFEASG
jgi:hypothetical protein